MDGWSAAQVKTFFASMGYLAANDNRYHSQLVSGSFTSRLSWVAPKMAITLELPTPPTA